MKKYFIYLLRCSDATLYTGYCADLKARETRHNSGKGAKYTKYRRPVKIVYWESFRSKSTAMRREAQIKSWPKHKKENLVKLQVKPL